MPPVPPQAFVGATPMAVVRPAQAGLKMPPSAPVVPPVPAVPSAPAAASPEAWQGPWLASTGTEASTGTIGMSQTTFLLVTANSTVNAYVSPSASTTWTAQVPPLWRLTFT